MYYTKILTDLTRQEKSPVNKMYLSEISLKWKVFRQIADDPKSTNESLSESLTGFLAALHNRKFLHSKTRNSGFYSTSAVFSSNYLYDLTDSLIRRQVISSQKGMIWDFQELNYAPRLSTQNASELAKQPMIEYQKTPRVLSLALSLDFQYRITERRNFNKSSFKIPLLLFFGYKKLKSGDLFMLDHYVRIMREINGTAEIFVLCETLSENLEKEIEKLAIKVFVMQTIKKNRKEEISLEMVNKLESAIKEALNVQVSSNLITASEKPAIVIKDGKKKRVTKKRYYKK